MFKIRLHSESKEIYVGKERLKKSDAYGKKKMATNSLCFPWLF